MSKIFLILSAVLLLGTAALGFLNKNKMAAKTEEIKKANGIATDAQTKAAKAQASQKETEKKLADANTKAAELQTQITAVNDEKTKLNDQIAEIKKAIDEKDAEIERQKKALAEVTGQKPATPGGPETPGLEAQLKDAITQRDELKAVKDGLESRAKNLESQIAKYRVEESRRERKALQPGLRGQILAVDRNWNFVVLSLGNRNGIVSGADMVVQRGGSLVGKVRITSVESSQSIADIVPNSVPPGVSVQAGDTVIYPGGS
jgi:hypothetical protein